MRHAILGGIALIILTLGAEPLLAQGRGGGPPFCRNGQGHPVHGWSWCVAKGWAPGSYSYAPVRGWEEVYWPDARFYRKRPIRHDVWLDRGALVEVVGERVLARLEVHDAPGRRARSGGPVRARWMSGDGGGAVLEVHIGSTPVAYLHDVSLDGRVDRVYLRPRR